MKKLLFCGALLIISFAPECSAMNKVKSFFKLVSLAHKNDTKMSKMEKVCLPLGTISLVFFAGSFGYDDGLYGGFLKIDSVRKRNDAKWCLCGHIALSTILIMKCRYLALPAVLGQALLYKNGYEKGKLRKEDWLRTNPATYEALFTQCKCDECTKKGSK